MVAVCGVATVAAPFGVVAWLTKTAYRLNNNTWDCVRVDATGDETLDMLAAETLGLETDGNNDVKFDSVDAGESGERGWKALVAAAPVTGTAFILETVFAGVAIWVWAWSGVRAQWKGQEVQGQGASWISEACFISTIRMRCRSLDVIFFDRRADSSFNTSSHVLTRFMFMARSRRFLTIHLVTKIIQFFQDAAMQMDDR